jgi:Immunoglobulin I-set domain
MSIFRSLRLYLLPALAGLLLLAGFASTPAWAESYGELLRFDGKGTGVTKGHSFELEEEVHAFGVDPADNSIFVGDKKGEESEEEFRIQKYSQAGAYEAQVVLKPGKTLPTGIEGVEDLDGIAVDSNKGRIYVLVTYLRKRSDGIDPGKEVAGAVYAFSTTPVGGELVPATGADPTTGLLGTLETLSANSETQGKALIEPGGIAVDPATHEVVILGHVDEGGGVTHVALVHMSETGTLGTTYVDPEPLGLETPPDSPVVSQNGTVFFEDEDELQQIPPGLTGAPEVIFHFEQPESLVQGPFKEELTVFGEDVGAGESYYGGGLAIFPEGASEGRLIADAEVTEVEPNGIRSEARNAAVLTFHYTEASGQATVSETGWTGAQPGQAPTKGSCGIGFAGNYPQIAGASGDDIFVLAPSTSEVLEFGPEASSTCPTAKASAPETLIEGHKTSEVNTSTPVTLAANVTGADVLGTEWKFTGAETATETSDVQPPVLPAEQIQTAELTHKFTKVGTVTVEAIIRTDDLATPELKVTTTVNVQPPEGAPKVTTQPAAQAVVEGQNATFKAAASGTPTITVQWEESRNEGKTWASVGAGTEGGITDTLTVSSTTAAESGREYRASFSNSLEKEIHSNAVTLTVETQAEYEAKKRKVEEEAAAKKAQEEAAARKAQEEAQARQQAQEAIQAQEAAAKKAQEEAAAKKAQEEANKPKTTPTEGSPAVQVASTSLPVSSSGTVSVKVSCPAGVSSCTGTVTLHTLGAVAARAVASKKSKSKPKASVLTLASGTFSLTGGQAKAITLHLSAAGRKLLAHSHTLRVRATIVARDPSGASSTTQITVTLHAAKAHR